MNVNLSSRQLAQPDVVSEVAEVLAATRVAPTSLILEITETTLMRDTEATLAKLRDLKGLGIRLAVDDFGTGYSSLGYLRRFPLLLRRPMTAEDATELLRLPWIADQRPTAATAVTGQPAPSGPARVEQGRPAPAER